MEAKALLASASMNFVSYLVAMPFERATTVNSSPARRRNARTVGAAESAACRMAETAAGAVAFSRMGIRQLASSRTRSCCASFERCRP